MVVSVLCLAKIVGLLLKGRQDHVNPGKRGWGWADGEYTGDKDVKTEKVLQCTYLSISYTYKLRPKKTNVLYRKK